VEQESDVSTKNQEKKEKVESRKTSVRKNTPFSVLRSQNAPTFFFLPLSFLLPLLPSLSSLPPLFLEKRGKGGGREKREGGRERGRRRERKRGGGRESVCVGGGGREGERGGEGGGPDKEEPV